jgi:hypothetical protein
MRPNRLAGALGVLLSAATAGAQQTQIDITAHMNDQLTTQYCCASYLYPTSGSLTNLGVTFSMASVAVPGDAPLDAWRGDYAANGMFTLPIGASVTKVYTLMDTWNGYAGDPNDPTTAQASLTFNFLKGPSITQYLYGCFNTRDHNPFGYSAGCWGHNQVAPSGSNAQQFASFDEGIGGAVVFDMQTWDVSSNGGSQQLQSITFQDYGPYGNTSFLRAVTIEVTP